jgi:hypothetical protein
MHGASFSCGEQSVRGRHGVATDPRGSVVELASKHNHRRRALPVSGAGATAPPVTNTAQPATTYGYGNRTPAGYRELLDELLDRDELELIGVGLESGGSSSRHPSKPAATATAGTLVRSSRNSRRSARASRSASVSVIWFRSSCCSITSHLSDRVDSQRQILAQTPARGHVPT